jgi:hypothetical protein
VRLEEDVGAVLVDDLVVLGRPSTTESFSESSVSTSAVSRAAIRTPASSGCSCEAVRLLIAVAAVSVIASKRPPPS